MDVDGVTETTPLLKLLKLFKLLKKASGEKKWDIIRVILSFQIQSTKKNGV